MGSAILWIVFAGLLLSILPLVLRQEEVRNPAPGDIQAKGGLDHMLVGAMAGLALIATVVGATFIMGIVVPVVVALAALVTSRLIDFGGALVRLYRFQLAFSVAALVAALVLWLNILTLILGVSS